MNCALREVRTLEFVPLPEATLHAPNQRELSERDLDDVAGGFLPLAALAEGVLVGLAVVGVVAVGVAGTALVYKAATGKDLF